MQAGFLSSQFNPSILQSFNRSIVVGIPKQIQNNCEGAIVTLKNDTTGDTMETMLLGRGPYGHYLKHINGQHGILSDAFIDASDWTIVSVLSHRPPIAGLCHLTESGKDRCRTEGGTPQHYLARNWVVTHHNPDDPALFFAVPQQSADYANGQWFHVNDVTRLWRTDILAAEHVRDTMARIVAGADL